jgi:hypothetical protein
MEVVHRLTFQSSSGARQRLAQFGLVVPGAGLVHIDVLQSHPRWPEIERYLVSVGALDVMWTEFSESEVADASWLVLWGGWHNGYPQPEDSYMNVTYGAGDCCRVCGAGAVQVGPFRLRGEPKWGRRSVMQLNWVFDEFFVKPDIWREVFAPFGVASRPVADRQGRELSSVVQLVIDEMAEIVEEGMTGESCGECGRVKFLPVVSRRVPRFVSTPTSPLVKSRQYFGSGGQAYRYVAGRRELAAVIRRLDLRGVVLKPMEE